MRRLQSSFLWFATVLLLPLIFSCGTAGDGDGDKGNNGDANNGDSNNTAVQRSCNASADCRGGEVCREQKCREACSEEDPCQGSLTTCDVERGYCVADNNGCQADSECVGGERCLDGTCTSIDDTNCEPNQVSCEGNLVLLCNPAGTGQERIPCAAGERCMEEGQGARCASQLCEPNAIGCLDNNTAFVCDAQGTSQTELPCRDNQFCQAGTCRQEICAPNTITCEGDNLLLCNAEGTSQDVQSCNDDCSAELGCTCQNGACQERACAPDSARCVGNASQTCDAQGLGYANPQDCGVGICISGQCVEATCEPGQSLCAGNTVLTCNAGGTGYREQSCSDTQACLEREGSASCIERVCEPNVTRCAPSGEVVLRCDALGSEELREPCAGGRFCQQGVCLEGLCNPGDDPFCMEGDVFACNARGSAYELSQMCLRNQLCRDGACLDRLCTPLSARCDGNTLVECAADGLSEQRNNCDEENRVCDDQSGSCITVSSCNPTPQCTPENPVLNEDTCQCVECLRNNDCSDGLSCVQKQCVRAGDICEGNSDCSSDNRCIDQRCVECINDGQCANDPDGSICREGVCSPCECSGNEICNGRGDCFDPNNCTTNSECFLNNTPGRCDQNTHDCYTPGLCGGGGSIFPDPFNTSCPGSLECTAVFQNIALSCAGCTTTDDCRTGELCVEDIYILGLFFCSTAL